MLCLPAVTASRFDRFLLSISDAVDIDFGLYYQTIARFNGGVHDRVCRRKKELIGAHTWRSPDKWIITLFLHASYEIPVERIVYPPIIIICIAVKCPRSQTLR